MKRAVNVGKPLEIILLTLVVLFAMATVLVVNVKAADLEEPQNVVEFISVTNDGTLRPLTTKYSINYAEEDGYFRTQLVAIDGYKPVQCLGWTRNGQVVAEITQAYEDFRIAGRVDNNTETHGPARILVFYDRDVETVALQTKFYAPDEIEPGMGSLEWAEKNEDGVATFEIPVSGDKTMIAQTGRLKGVETTCDTLEDGRLANIIVKTDKDLVLSIYNEMDGYVDYILTASGADGAIVISMQRCKLMVSIRHYVESEEAVYGEEFEATLGDDGYTTIYLPVQEGFIYLGWQGVADIAIVEVETDEETGFVETIKATINRHLIVDIYHEAASGTDRYVLHVDGDDDLGENVLLLQRVNSPFDGPED